MNNVTDHELIKENLISILFLASDCGLSALLSTVSVDQWFMQQHVDVHLPARFLKAPYV